MVVLVVSQVVANLRQCQGGGGPPDLESERLYELSQALIGDLTLSQLLTHMVGTVQSVFTPRWTALVLPEGRERRSGPERRCGSRPGRANR